MHLFYGPKKQCFKIKQWSLPVLLFFILSHSVTVGEDSRPVFLPQPQQIVWHPETCPAAAGLVSSDINYDLIKKWMDKIGFEQDHSSSAGLILSLADSIGKAAANEEEASRTGKGINPFPSHQIKAGTNCC